MRQDLESIPVLLEDLTVTISRQDKIGDPSPGRMNERPLPLRLGPLEAKRDLEATLWAWARHVAKRVSVPPPVARPDSFLLGFLPSAASDPSAGDLADEVGYAVITGRRAVDKPLQLIFVGPCDKCSCDLYAHPRSLTVACRQVECDAEYRVEERREWLLLMARDQLLSAAEISRALPGLMPRQQKLTSSMVRGWAHHGRLAPKPPHPDKPREPRYRLGDVLIILDDIFAREALPKKVKR